MPEALTDVVHELRSLLLDPTLDRAVAAGRRHGQPAPAWRRAELRPVDLKVGRRLQEVRDDGRSPLTRNLEYGPDAAACVEELLALPWGNWHVRTAATTVQVRVTKKGEAQVHREAVAASAVEVPRPHDRVKARLLEAEDPLFSVLGAGAAKRRQVEAFLRLLSAELDVVAGRDPLHVVDLGCGNAYLSFAALRYLTEGQKRAVRLSGVDRRPEAAQRNAEVAVRLGVDAAFVAGDIADAEVAPADVALALHACDTATDEALARAVRWETPLIVAAPCCHHEAAATVRSVGAPGAYAAVARHGILRERMADVLTDGLRAMLLRLCGYRVDVVEFVSSEHTARNVAIRAVRTGAAPEEGTLAAYRELTDAWGLRPRLAVLLHDELTQRHGGQW
ncbi:MAG: methyltransferase [Sporichthyaceae bacterium]